ncbi:MAG: DUF4129 domain-containing protein [Clostridiaceae bacterium]|nr:DUF4129 domain-containing protein [Clostridiaceae bacterium]
MRLIKKMAADWLKSTVEIIMLSLILCVITVIVMPVPNCYIWVAAMPVFSLLGILLHALLKRVPILEFMFCAILSAALAYCISLPLTSTVPELVCMTILGTVFSIRARFIASRSWDEVSPIYLFTMFMVFNLIFAMFASIIPVLEPFRPAATVLGPIIVIVGLLAMNQLNIISLTDVQRDNLNAGNMIVSKTMNLQNKLLLVGIYVIILGVSCIGILIKALKWLAWRLYDLIMWLMELLDGGSGSTGSDSGGGQPDLGELFGTEETVRNPLWERIQEILIHIVVILAVTVFAVFMLFMLYKGIRRLIAFLKAVKFGGDGLDAGAEEYVDTRERLVDLKDLPAQYLKRAKDWLSEQLRREPPWNDLKSVPEKVRALYRRAIYKASSQGFKHKDTYTPAEEVPKLTGYVKTDEPTLDTLRTYYEEVRYGNRAPSSDAVEQMNKKI